VKPSDVAFDSLGAIAEDDTNRHLRRLVDAVLAPADLIHEIVGEAEKVVLDSAGNPVLGPDGEVVTRDVPGWSLPFDLDRAQLDPAPEPPDPEYPPDERTWTSPQGVLPWAAQFVGSTITPAMSVADAKTAIRTPDGFSRGLQRAVRAAGERTLTGTRRLIIQPRTPDDLTVYVRTLAVETPDVEVTRAVLRAQIPWWLRLNYVAAVRGLDYDDVALEWESFDALEATGITYGEIEEMLPVP